MQKKVKPFSRLEASAFYGIAETKIINGQVYLQVEEHRDGSTWFKWINYSQATNDSEKVNKKK